MKATITTRFDFCAAYRINTEQQTIGRKRMEDLPEEHAEAWMIQEINGDVLKNNSGKVQCSKVLNEPQHWRE